MRQDVEDEICFARNVAVDVVGELLGEIEFELGVGVAVGGIGAEVVAQGEVVVEGERSGWANVEVLGTDGFNEPVGVTVGDALVAAVLVAESSEGTGDGGEAVSGGDDDVEIDDGLGR